jgi:chloride channel 2
MITRRPTGFVQTHNGKELEFMDIYHARPEEASLPGSRPKKRSQRTELSHYVWSHVREPLALVLVGVCSALLSCIINVSITLAFDLRQAISTYMGFIGLAVFSLLCVGLSAMIVRFHCPAAAGSGVPDVKTAISGVIDPAYFTFKVLVVKSCGLIAAFASGLSIGKKGPFVHLACIMSNLILSLSPFQAIRQDPIKRLDFMAAACAAGVATTFGAPFGGTLFSVEITASYFMTRNLSKAFTSAVCGTVMIQLIRSAAIDKVGSTMGSLLSLDLFPAGTITSR